jgi:hypothetical protein
MVNMAGPTSKYAFASTIARQLLELDTFPSKGWIGEGERLARLVSLFGRINSPRGASYDLLSDLHDTYPKATNWKHTISIANCELLVADALTCDPLLVHPVRLTLMYNQIHRLISNSAVLEHPEVITSDLEELLKKASGRIKESALGLIGPCISAIREGNYSRVDLLDAFAYPLVDRESFKYMFNSICGENLYFSEEPGAIRPTVPQRDFAWSNISSEPIDIVRLLVEHDLPEQATFIDLGCGSGGALFPFVLLTNWICQGVEIEKEWCEVAIRVADRLHRQDVVISQEDLLTYSFGERDFYYIYSPFRDGPDLPKFIDHLAEQVGDISVLFTPTYKPLLRELRDRANYAVREVIGDLNLVCG